MTPEEKKFSQKLDSFISDLPEDASLFQKIAKLITNPDEAQRLGRRAFSNQFLSLLIRAINPFASLSKAGVTALFGLSSVSGIINELKAIDNVYDV